MRMTSMFSTPAAQWPQPHDALHLYVLPGPALVERLDVYRTTLEDCAGLGVQPAAYLHATIAKLPFFLDRMPDPDRSRLAQELDALLAGMAPFELEFAPPRAEGHGVTCWGAANDGWRRLLGVASAVSAPLAPDVLTGTPHLTLAYALRDLDGGALQRRLDERAATADPPLRLRVTEVHLVPVRLDAAAGVYSWTTSTRHPLAGE